jgi:hypothetical protein
MSHRRKSFAEEGTYGGGEGVSLQGATINVDGGGGAVRGNVFGRRDAVEVFAGVDKGGGHTELAHVFEGCGMWRSAGLKAPFKSAYMT